MKTDKSKINKILIIQLKGIGDVVLTTPVLSVLKTCFPAAEIDFLTSQHLKALLSGLSDISNVITYPKSDKRIFQVLSLFLRIRKNKYDLIIDYQCTPGTAQLVWFSGAVFRLGWKMKRRQWAYNLFSEANVLPEYVALQKCHALREIGIEHSHSKLVISLNKNDIVTVDRYLHSEEINTDHLLINMTPKGQVPTREWPPEKYIQLADLLIKKHRATVFFSGNIKDKNEFLGLASQSEHNIKVIPQWPLHTFSAFLSKVHLHFSYDNGPKHLAIAVGTATLSLFATDPPFLWNPPDNPEHPFILGDVHCKFCHLLECPLMICMESITPEMVLKKIEEIPSLKRFIR